MSLAHNFRNISRSFIQNFAHISRWIMVFVISFVFLIGLFYVGFGNFLKISEGQVLGDESRQDIDIERFVNQAALDISHQNLKEARRLLSIILEFEPGNVYAIEMNRKLVLQFNEVEKDILKTLKIVEVQPNWREAWIKLADLYEKTGNSKLAAEAREKARNLKTS